MYLTPSDYEFIIRSDVLSAINDGSETRLEKAERAAAKFMMSHLAKRYDIAKIFYPVTKYDPLKSYVTGQMVYWDDDDNEQEYKVYEASQAIAANISPSNELWELSEKRDELVMMYLADITAWNFYAADGPVMNETVKERYREATKWVKGVGTGEMIADLPASTSQEGDEGHNPDIRFGSHDQEDNKW